MDFDLPDIPELANLNSDRIARLSEIAQIPISDINLSDSSFTQFDYMSAFLTVSLMSTAIIMAIQKAYGEKAQ